MQLEVSKTNQFAGNKTLFCQCMSYMIFTFMPCSGFEVMRQVVSAPFDAIKTFMLLILVNVPYHNITKHTIT